MWNPSGYEEFSNERIQPSIDLAARVKQLKPGINSILDIGCGSGLSTLALKKLWSGAEITGADSSVNMIEKAKKTLPDISFIIKDCSNAVNINGTYDLVFSNAFLQWITEQEAFIRDIRLNIADNGILAMQIPNYENMAVARCVQKAAAMFKKYFKLYQPGCGSYKNKTSIQPETICFTYEPADYYNIYASHYSYIEIWETHYFHQMKNHMDIVNFISTTALAPYLDILNKEYHKPFKETVLYYVKQAYPLQQNGIILFPFRRIFIIARK